MEKLKKWKKNYEGICEKNLQDRDVDEKFFLFEEDEYDDEDPSFINNEDRINQSNKRSDSRDNKNF